MINLLHPARHTGGNAGPEESRNARFERILEQHYRHVYRILYRMVGNAEEAADLTQDVFVRIYRALPRLRAEGASTAWVCRIAVNVGVDHLRRCRRSLVAYSLDAGTGDAADAGTNGALREASVDPAELAEREEQRSTIRSAIAELPTDYRDVLALHHLEGMQVDEMAQRLGIPVGTVKSRLSRARNALRRRLAPLIAAGALTIP